MPLTNDVIADLWVSDYPNLRFTNNVNATTLPDNATINEDGTLAATPVNAFQPPAAPQLAAALFGTNLMVSWISPAPGFVLQEINQLNGGTNNWLDTTDTPWLAGASNIVTLPLVSGTPASFIGRGTLTRRKHKRGPCKTGAPSTSSARSDRFS